MARKTRKKALLFALEATYGVDAIAAGVPVAVLGRDVKIFPIAGDNTELKYDDGKLGNSPELATEVYATVEFSVDLAGSGTANLAPAWAPLVQACSRDITPGASSVVMAINEDSTASLTMYMNYHGVLHALLGARGTFKISAKAKELPSIMFTFTGLFVPVTAAAMPATNFAAWKKPQPVGVKHSAFSLAGAAAKLISFEYDQANTVAYTEYVGFEEVLITDFKPSGKIIIEAASLAEFDPFTLAANNTEVAMEFSHGSALNQVVWSSSRISLGRPEYGDQDGTLTYEIPFKPISTIDQLTTK